MFHGRIEMYAAGPPRPAAQSASSWPEVVVIGSACVDIKGSSGAPLLCGTSNPGRVRVGSGGVARNVAESLSRLGLRTTLLSAVGQDYFGRQVMEQTAAGGVDTSNVLVSPGLPTSTYLALLDQVGGLITAVDNTDVLALLTPDYVTKRADLLRHARMIVVDANLPVETLDAVLDVAGIWRVPVCADPVSVALASRLRPRLGDYALVTPSALQAEVLVGERVASIDEAARAADLLADAGVGAAVITLGIDGVFYAAGSARGHVPAIRTEMVDHTGAGDALTAAIVFGLVNGFSIDEAVRLGVSAAALTLQCADSVCPDLSLEQLYEEMVM